MATKRKRDLEDTPASRPLRRLARAAVEQQFRAALEAREGVAGAHCIHERWMRNEPPRNVERMLEQLWQLAPARVPFVAQVGLAEHAGGIAQDALQGTGMVQEPVDFGGAFAEAVMPAVGQV